MGITDLLRRNSSVEPELADAEKDVAQYFTVGKISDEDCEGCTACYPSSLSIDDGPLFNSSPKAYGQILVATGQTNWIKDIGEENTPWGRVCHALADHSGQFEKLAGGPVRINGTDMEFDDAEDAGKVAVIVLPQFIRINTDAANCVKDVETVFKIEPGSELPDTMIPLHDRGYILLCSHRTRDKRCGITAPIMKKSLEVELRHEDLYRDPDDDDRDGIRVVLCNHVGGHKFAANVLIYQNTGMALMLARVRPEHAKFIVQKTILSDVVAPDHVRFCNKLVSFEW